MHAFCRMLIFFSKSTFTKNSFGYTIRVSNSLDPDQARHFVGPALGPNCFERSDDTSIQSKKLFSTPTSNRCVTSVTQMTRDRGASGSSLTGVTALWSLSKTLVQPRKTRPSLTERLFDGGGGVGGGTLVFSYIRRFGPFFGV